MQSVEVYIPSCNDYISNECINKWYNNIFMELKMGLLTQHERKYLAGYYEKAGLLSKWRRPYFYHHFAGQFTKMVKHFQLNKLPRRILDLGCGVGTQSLFFSLMGAEVISIDKNEMALSIFKKRRILYEQIIGRQLKIQMYCADALSFNYKSIEPIDCVHSMFAFSTMTPSPRLITLFTEACTLDSSLAILDTNFASWKFRLKKPRWIWRVLLPKEISACLKNNGWQVKEQTGGVCIPPAFCNIFAGIVLCAIDRCLSRTLFFPGSYVTLAKRESSRCV